MRLGDTWLSVDAAVESGAQDELLAEYHKLRSQFVKSTEGQLTLARWCQKHHLTDEMRAHATRLLAVRQNDPELLQMLDLTWYKGQLVGNAEMADLRERDEKARAAMQHWRPIVAAIRAKIEGKSTGEHEQGLEELAAIHDPAAIEAMLAVLRNRPSSLCEALRVIGQMPGQEATDALLQQAVLSKNDQVVVTACRQLKGRSMYGYVPKLMAALSTPAQTRLEVDRDDAGIHIRETIQREGENGIVAKTVDTEVGLVSNPFLANIIGQAYREMALDAVQTAKAASKLNQKLKGYNDAIYRVLDSTVGKVAPHDPSSWWDWWHSYNVMSSSKKPVYVDKYYNPIDVPNYSPQDTRIALTYEDLRRHAGCFACGTMVWTASGQVPIEEIQIGDRVLAQSALTGELTFKPVLDITVGHQEFLSLTTTEKETLVPTRGHAFWVSGLGWRLATRAESGRSAAHRLGLVGDRKHQAAQGRRNAQPSGGRFQHLFRRRRPHAGPRHHHPADGHRWRSRRTRRSLGDTPRRAKSFC